MSHSDVILGSLHGPSNIKWDKGDIFIGTGEGLLDVATNNGNVRIHATQVVDGSVVASRGGTIDLSIAEVRSEISFIRIKFQRMLRYSLDFMYPKGVPGTFRAAADHGALHVTSGHVNSMKEWHGSGGPGNSSLLVSSGGGSIQFRECSWFEASAELTNRLDRSAHSS